MRIWEEVQEMLWCPMMERALASFVEAFYYQVWNIDDEAASRETLQYGAGGSQRSRALSDVDSVNQQFASAEGSAVSTE